MAGSKVAPLIGMLAGMLLLGFAGTLMVMGPSSVDLEAGARRLSLLTGTNTTAQQQTLQTTGRSWFGGIAGNMFLSLLFGVLYKSHTVDEILSEKKTLKDQGYQQSPDDNGDNDDFEHSIFGCFSNPWVMIHGLCCPVVRMAHTNTVAGIGGFWGTAVMLCCCAGLTGNLGTCCLMVYWRKQLKEAMGIEDHLVNDMIVTCLCPYLSICQQGSAVDSALGYEVTGCCDLEWMEGE